MSIKIYTKTKHQKTNNNKYISKMFAVIEGPIHQMMIAYPTEFQFIRHESTRSLRPSKKDKANEQ
jgi:hypothetical protein|tara:strand:+ start:781 stop:975 length:195 start_codon:yes stop_codon:yes gene_type:complete